jgi:hypothetical protein
MNIQMGLALAQTISESGKKMGVLGTEWMISLGWDWTWTGHGLGLGSDLDLNSDLDWCIILLPGTRIKACIEYGGSDFLDNLAWFERSTTCDSAWRWRCSAICCLKRHFSD